MSTTNGFLLLADITGYTNFLANTPTDIGGRITANLLDGLVETVIPPFKVGNIEGDAIFVYAPDDGSASGQTVLDAVDSLYCAFADRVCALRYGANCPSDPALLAGALDLKLVVHYGEYAINRIGDREELSGSAVVALHRLAKNTVTQDTGHSGYAMLTSLAINHMELKAFFDELETRQEEIEHLGAIDTYVYPLAPVWERLRRGVRRFVEKSEPLLIDELTIDLPVPPCRAWELSTEPQYRVQWISGVKDISSEGLDHGRAGLGTVQYCDHGDGMVVPVTVSDWRPFDYISYKIETPLGLVVDQTIEMQPIGNGTRLSIRCAKPHVDGLIARWRSRSSIDTLCGLFKGLYENADSTLNRLARSGTTLESS
jgi:hypothetical protein